LNILEKLPDIRNVNFVGNPIYEPAAKDETFLWVLKKKNDLANIDGNIISEKDK